MIPVQDAMNIIFEQIAKMPIIDRPLTGKYVCYELCRTDRLRDILECLNYICAEEIVAKEPFPPFRASVKDGYAVRLYSIRSHEQIYEIIGRSDAGGESVSQKLEVPIWNLLVIISISGKHFIKRRTMCRDQYRCQTT